MRSGASGQGRRVNEVQIRLSESALLMMCIGFGGLLVLVLQSCKF